MSLRLPRFLRSIPLTESNGTPTLAFHQWWDTTLRQIETSVGDIQTALSVAGIALDGVGVISPFSTRTVASNTSLTNSDCLVLVDASGGDIVIDLPSAASKEGFEIIVKKVDNSVNTVTVEPNGAETIDGAGDKILASQYETCRVASDGTAWWVT